VSGKGSEGEHYTALARLQTPPGSLSVAARRTPEAMNPPCPLCSPTAEDLVHRDEQLRVILVDDPDYPGYARVIWNAHVAEMSELAPADREHLMRVVMVVESVQRRVLAPHKINLASLGNLVPHLHWHLIPRYTDDAHFPQPIWGSRLREPDPQVLAARRARLPALRAALADAFGT
jgi:diadenosine tetraphosphate (Ap4A) HIT family hydrolase